MLDATLTILVPTHDRPQFLRRLLKFYSQCRPKFFFMVVDSSQSVFAEENRQIVDGVSDRLNIVYRHNPLSFFEKISSELGRVTTPFVALCADDDCLLPETVVSCVEYLATKSGYSSVLGHKAQLNTTIHRWPSHLKILKGYSIERDSILERCRMMATRWYSNFYAVHHTTTLQRNFQIVAANSSSRSLPQLPEMLMSQLSVICGRIKVLPAMYSISQRHESNCTNTVARCLQPNPEQYYEQFQTCLIHQLLASGIAPASSEALVEEWFGHFRHPNFATRRKPLSTAAHINRAVRGLIERLEDFLWTDQVRHCRGVRSRDLVGCQSSWHAAVKIIREFPHGIPDETMPLQRSA